MDISKRASCFRWGIISLRAIATMACAHFQMEAADEGLPAKLNGSLRSGRHIEDFATAEDNKWVVYRADQDTEGVLEIYSRPIAGSGDPIRLNGPLTKGSSVEA